MSTKKTNRSKKGQVKKATTQGKKDLVPLASRKELTEAVILTDQKLDYMYSTMSTAMQNLIFIVDKLAIDVPVFSEIKYSQEYLSENVRHIFTNLYFDNKEEDFIRLTPIIQGYKSTKGENSWTFEKEGAPTHVIEGEESELAAMKSLRDKLRSSVTFPSESTLESNKEMVTEIIDEE